MHNIQMTTTGSNVVQVQPSRQNEVETVNKTKWAGIKEKGKGKVFPYSLPSVGPGADPRVQAVSPQVT